MGERLYVERNLYAKAGTGAALTAWRRRQGPTTTKRRNLYVRYSIFHVLSIASWLFGCCEPQELVVDVLMPRIAPAS